MRVRRRSPGWIWGGRAVAAMIVAGLVVYLARVGLDNANKLAGVISAVVAVLALVAPYLLPPLHSDHAALEAQDSGAATARAGGRANTGIRTTGRLDDSARVARSGDARADGSGSVANTGIQAGPESHP